MPDLTEHTAFTCSSNIMWGPIKMKSASTGETYHVSWGRLFGRDRERSSTQYGWLCTCKGFKFKGTCKHIQAVDRSGRRCTWNAELEPSVEPGNDPTGEPICPQCGRDAHAMRVAV